MTALLDSLLAGRDDAAADAIRAAGLPGPRSEAWKYTPLRALERRTFAPAADIAADPSLLDGIPAPRIVFVNGRFDAGLSDISALPAGLAIDTDAGNGEAIQIPAHPTLWQPAGDEVFRNLNALLAVAGARINVTGQIDAPLHLVSLSVHDGADRALYLHHRLHLHADAALVLVEHQLGDGEHANLDNARVDIQLDAGARLSHLRVQDDNVRATRFLHSAVTLAAKADYRRLDLEIGAALSRHQLDIRLDGEAANLHCAGVLLADGKRHLDTRLGIVHGAKDTHSTLPWRGLADGRARAVFHGGITIEAGADGSEADLQNRNLLLADSAEIDTQPVLVIHADEVKAAHGATVGQLDASALFYLRSRGIAEHDARRILTAAFVRDVLSMVEDDALRTMLQSRLEHALARMQAA
ncbi:MAG: Fe-S cluster assembly protein SufD [Pseudomonadota bacterium]|nr:Fe-S cluster assembly protein SufD [Pseudomonadota bacterium]